MNKEKTKFIQEVENFVDNANPTGDKDKAVVVLAIDGTMPKKQLIVALGGTNHKVAILIQELLKNDKVRELMMHAIMMETLLEVLPDEENKEVDLNEKFPNLKNKN